MEKTDILQALQSYFAVRNITVDGESALLSEGLIDSFELMEMILHLEESLGIDVDQDILTLENFDRLENFVTALHQSQPAQPRPNSSIEA